VWLQSVIHLARTRGNRITTRCETRSDLGVQSTLGRRLGGPQSRSENYGNIKLPSLSLPGIRPQFKRLVAGFSPRRPWFEPISGQVGFVVNNVALGQVSSVYFSFPCQFSFRRLLHTHLSSGAGAIAQIVALHPKKLNNYVPTLN
jgi:hypothetical protein